MIQRKLLSAPSSCGVFLLMTALFTMSSCGLFKSANNHTTEKGTTPTDYNKPTPGTKPTPNQLARMSYIDKFKRIAISEMERTGVPASIKLAQGLLESDAGRSLLSSTYNNHFGIKCHSDWQGDRYYQEDDDIDPLTGKLMKSCFRAYKNPDESFTAHSDFLRDPRKVNRYGFLFQLKKTDYVGWAEGLERAGYATATDYSEKLVRMIEDYQLSQYDNLSLRDVAQTTTNTTPTGTNRPNDDFPTGRIPTNNGTPNNTANNNSANGSWLPGWDNIKSQEKEQGQQDTEGVRNNTKYARAYGNMTPYELAGKYGISIGNLQTYNEELIDPRTPMPDGTVVYLQKKRNYWTGTEKTYRVRDCETMYDISQKFGIKLSKLYSKNEMRSGEQPAIGQIIMLRRGWFEGADKPALRDTFGEWRRCTQPSPTTNPSTVGTNGQQNSGGGLGFDLTPTTGNPTTPVYQPPTTDVTPTTPTYTETNPTTPTYTETTPTYTETQPSSPSSNPYPSPNRPTTTTRPATTPSKPATRPTTTTTKPNPSKPTPAKPATTPTKPSATTASPQYHTVGVKETLWGISRIYGTTVDKLKELNGLNDNNIKIGMQLRVK